MAGGHPPAISQGPRLGEALLSSACDSVAVLVTIPASGEGTSLDEHVGEVYGPGLEGAGVTSAHMPVEKM